MSLQGQVYVVGGVQRAGAHFRDEWRRHRMGRILSLDLATGACKTCLEYVTPPEALPEEPDPAILFKAATHQGQELHGCTQTEIFTWSLPDFSVVRRISLPAFNDVHHVRLSRGGNYLVANTGLDMVMEVSTEGEILRLWNVLEESDPLADPWGRFSPQKDYRKEITTKPHGSHPNYVFEAQDGEIWATRFEQRDAVCLTSPGRRIEIALERPHDGVVRGDKVAFTVVSGHLVIAQTGDGAVLQRHDLQELAETDFALGWCRGLHHLDDDLVLVGFSRLRPTKIHQNLRWVGNRLGLRKAPDQLPTRIALYDLKRQSLVREWNLEDHGLNVLFSIHPASGGCLS
ncbi:MAG: hypothetical protein K0U98_02050 [Deltaproteobacteria bacterium]|nr:hypothetical protein [Deltaproteobacteria bacterium]